MGRRVAPLVLALLVGGAALAAGATASSTQRPPAGSPDLAEMALVLSDLPRGARIERQGYYRDPDFVASYEREFSLPGLRLGRSRVVFLLNDLSVASTALDAMRTFAGLRSLLATRAFRAELAETIADEAGTAVTSVTAGRPRQARIGDGAVSVSFRIRAQRLTLSAVLTFLRVDRVLGIVGFIGAPGRQIFAADVDRLDRVSAARMRAGLVPTLRAPPVLAGTPVPGQSVTATQGTWTGDELTFTYRWERCDETGAGCVVVPGAAAATYAVTPGDLASTLRVTVEARNRLGTVTGRSNATAVVTGPAGAPTATAAPTVTGTPQVGATLTAATGTWVGDPTTFTYQWRRCNGAGRECVDVPGATASTYAISTADSSRTLRVLVVASNAIGPGGAISAPTAAVP
jgi:hypothetical protein